MTNKLYHGPCGAAAIADRSIKTPGLLTALTLRNTHHSYCTGCGKPIEVGVLCVKIVQVVKSEPSA